METQIKVYCTPLKYTKADDLLTKDTDFMGIFVIFNAFLFKLLAINVN